MRNAFAVAALAATWLALGAGGTAAAEGSSLLDPQAWAETAPDQFRVRFTTTRGDFVVEVKREWTPHGADRFYNLVKAGFYDGAKFFRVVPGFVVQFGMKGEPAVDAAWSKATIPDDPVVQSNRAGYVTFAKSQAPNSRTTQVFINLRDNTRLDSMGFAPFGRVVAGMEVVEALFGGYGDGPPAGRGPSQARIAQEGNAYLEREFPKLDGIVRAVLEP